jgi:hypothetical protein
LNCCVIHNVVIMKSNTFSKLTDPKLNQRFCKVEERDNLIFLEI